VTRRPGYLLHVEEDELDRHRFERLIAQARAAAEAGQLEESLARYLRAGQLWRGAPLADVPPTATVTATAASLSELHLAGLEARYGTALRLGQGADLAAELTELVAAHPLRERLVILLMQVLHRGGRTADALNLYERTKQRLGEELGIDPGPELRRVHVGILQGDTRADDPAPTATTAELAPAPPRPAQLPADLASFTGRVTELAELLAAASTAEPVTVIISAIDGMAGVGKTALALHAAHRVAPSFPDGQLFVDLQGFTGGVAPLDAGEALDRMLRSLGHPGDRIPAGTAERSSLYRSLLAGRRMVVVLDNAANERQVQPLLPGDGGCLVLVTSRRRLTGLDDARPLSLDVLPAPDAIALFTTVAGEDRLAGEPAGLVARAVELCGRLPLAIRIAATRLRARPSWTLAHLVERLQDGQPRLAELETGSRSLAAAFDLSYRQLTPDQRAVFRGLGLHPGVDIEPYAAAALTGTPAPHAERALEALVDAHLLQSPAPRRYRFHDLLRAYAAEVAGRDEPAADRLDALARLCTHYLDYAAAATGVLYPYGQVDPAPAGHSFASPAAAAAWLDAELANLLATAPHAADHGCPGYPSRLSQVLFRHLNNHSRFADAYALHTLALRAADRVGDVAGRARTRHHLGATAMRLGRHQEARDQLGEALALYRQTEDDAGLARTLSNLGTVHLQLGRLEEGLDQLQQALGLRRRLGDLNALASTLVNLGAALAQLGRHDEALDHLEEALALHRRTGDLNSQALALGNIGLVNRQVDRYDEAAEQFRQALALFAEIGNVAYQADTLCNLGDIYQRLGRYGDAADQLRRALALLDEIGDAPRAEKVRADLQAIAHHPGRS
jgi:tetratricopeptide (TPR) repeat protein